MTTLVTPQLGSDPPQKGYLRAELRELIASCDKQITEKGALLYHYHDRLNGIESLTSSEFVLIQNWVEAVEESREHGMLSR